MRDNIVEPIYKKIALDLAGRIQKGEIKIGAKIHGRSTLAGEYNVSPETIRRAMILLEDMGVVAINQGSGIYIKSKESAAKFLERFQNKESIGTFKSEIKKLFKERRQLESKINELFDKIIDYSDRLKNINPVNPVEFEIPENCHLIGKTIIESKFWQNTGATIVGIRRKGDLILSPGPYADFAEGDIFISVGNFETLAIINKYLNEG